MNEHGIDGSDWRIGRNKQHIMEHLSGQELLWKLSRTVAAMQSEIKNQMDQVDHY